MRVFPLLFLSCLIILTEICAQTVIGGLTPENSAMLDVRSTSKGVLFPRMNTSQRDAISQAATGLMIFNTTSGCLEINLGSGAASWQKIKCTPIAALNCAGATVTGTMKTNQAASSVSVNVSYTSGNGEAHLGQTVSSTVVLGLTATLLAGNFATGSGSLTYNITGTPTSGGLASFALAIGGQSCELLVPVDFVCGAYVGSAWKEFKCHNLGAANSYADPFIPSWEINGSYYQWGKPTEAAPGPTGINGVTPNDGLPGSWTPTGSWSTSAAANGAWADGSKTGNDPCPQNFRVPTQSQWAQVVNNVLNPRTTVGPWTNGATQYGSGAKFGNDLFLPSAGSRNFNDGSLLFRGASGNYWTSTEASGGAAFYLLINASTAGTVDNTRTLGLSVRCISEL
jgi:uncharacterized protein (TIGR02145 family)